MDRKQRSPGIEILRCLLMFLIVLFHNWMYGAYAAQSGDGPIVWWTFIFSMLLIWHVDGFVAISGWFGIKFSFKKFWSLWAQIAFYGVVGLVLWLWFDRASFPNGMTMLFRWSPRLIDAGWFGGCYLMLMLVAPFVNAGIERLHEQGVLGRSALCVVGGMVCAWAPQCALTGIWPSGLSRCSFLTVLFVYFCARVLRVILNGRQIPRCWLVVLLLGYFVVAVSCVAGWLGYLHFKGIPWNLKLLETYWDYYAPQVVMCAVAALLYFAWYVKVPEWIGKLVAFLGPSMFGVYLLHDVLHFSRTHTYVVLQNWLIASFDPHPLFVLFAAALVTFAACVAMDLLRRWLFWKAGGIWNRFTLRRAVCS